MSYSQNWAPFDKGFNSFVRCVYHDSLSGINLCRRRFWKKADSTVMGIAFWDGNEWQSLGLGMDAQHSSGFLTMFNLFSGMATTSMLVEDLIRQEQYTLIPLLNGTGYNGIVCHPDSIVHHSDFRIIDNELYICGTFDTVGNIVWQWPDKMEWLTVFKCRQPSKI